jgi:hypothetical protein
MSARCAYLVMAILLLAPALCADAPAASGTAKNRATLQIPYKLTDTQHVLVRAKINGRGPFNFIIDTGAPLLYVSTPVGKKLGLTPDKKGWDTLDRFEIEGGAVLSKIRCRVETPFQLEGMNAMGLAGVELHGIIGYTVLANYRMEFDFTRDKMAWTRLDFTPPAPIPVGAKAGAAAGIESMAGLMKLASFLLGTRAQPEVTPRGFLGMEMKEIEGAVVVVGVLPQSPAAVAGVKSGDRIARINNKSVATMADVNKLTARGRVGEVFRFTVVRGVDRMNIDIRAGEGL